MKLYSAKLVSHDKKYAIVCSRFNEFIVAKLLDGALDALRRHGVKDEDIQILWVPGAFEIPVIASHLAQDDRVDAVICLGAVIRGATSHYELVSNEVAKGISQVGIKTGKPVSFGVITTENIEQAIERAGSKAGNKGAEAALTAIEMANLIADIRL